MPRKAPPHSRELFTVSEGLKYLEEAELARLTESYRTWVDASRDERTRRSRERVWLVYLLLRYTGGRLGEVLALDERRDLDHEHSLVRLHSGREVREVVVPGEVLEQVRAFMDAHPDAAKPGKLFALDQGFIRRKFHEQQEASGLDKEKLNPRVLRNSRAVEMLRGGVPLRGVQAILGHSSANLTSSFVTFRDEDIKSIVHSCIQRETAKKTSARNTFAGDVTEVREGHILSEVTLKTEGGYRIASVITNESVENLGIEPGITVSAIIKAPHVILVRDDTLEKTSASNRLPGVITRINTGVISAEVVGELEDGTTMCALVTHASVRRLGLELGQRIWFLFKSFSVILNVD